MLIYIVDTSECAKSISISPMSGTTFTLVPGSVFEIDNKDNTYNFRLYSVSTIHWCIDIL